MDHPNVLVVMSDEQSWDTLGSTGNQAARTPHLDEFAEEATSFDGCYTPFPLCCPSRASLWTGLMPRHHGVLGNWRPIEDQYRGTGVAEAFRNAGYHTIYNGKWHVPGTTPEEMGWSATTAIPAVVGGQDRGRYIEPYRSWAATRGYRFDPDHIENLTEQDLAGLTEHPYTTAEVSSEDFLESWQCEEFLRSFNERPTDVPWLAVCSFNAPHFPMVVPRPYDSLIDRDLIRLPQSLATGHASKPREVRASRFAAEFEHLSHEEWIEVTAHYLGLCALVDTQFGRIREHLKRAGQWDNTIVVFTSDHGDMMGAHGLMEKGHWLHYEEALRVPLLIRAPGARAGSAPHLVSVTDIGPTLCELAGVDWRDPIDGRSFATVVGDSTAPPIRDHVTAETMLRDGRPGGRGEPFHARDWEYPRDSLNASIRTDRYRYIFRSDDEDEFYDLAEDPHEQVNTVADPATASESDRLRLLLAEEIGDVLPDAAELIRRSSWRDSATTSQISS